MHAQMCPAVSMHTHSPWVEKADKYGMYRFVCPVGVCPSYSLMATEGHGLGVWGAGTNRPCSNSREQLLCVLFTVLATSAWEDLSDTVQGQVLSPTQGKAQVRGQRMSYYPQSRESRAVKIHSVRCLKSCSDKCHVQQLLLFPFICKFCCCP